MRRLGTKKRLGTRGFTLVELMIATAVFGAILLVVATAILQITRLYYKGLTEAKVQQTARSVADLISQSIQFNGGNVTTTAVSPTPGTPYAFCVGNTQYSYTTGYQLADSPGATQTYHALVAYDVSGCSSSTPAQNVRTSGISGRELLAPGMRLARLQISSPSTGFYIISVRIVFGDDDLVYSPSSPANPNGYQSADAACRTNIVAGTQFCAASDIVTTVVKRVQ